MDQKEATGEENWLQDGQDKLLERQEDGRASRIGCRTRRKGYRGEQDWLQDGQDKLQERMEDSKMSTKGCRTRRIGYRVNRTGYRMGT